MDLNKSTKILPIIDKYPKVYDALYKLSPKVKRLKNPIAKKAIGGKATLEMISGMIKIYNENLLIMRSRGCRITFRDITTGEIIKILDKPRLHETPFVNKQYLVCSDTDGNLWIIDPLIKKRRKGVN